MFLIAELKRRNIFRVAVLYVLIAWFVLQVTDLLLTTIGSGGWIYRFLFGLGVICFPLVLIFSYVFEITPIGLRKEHQVERQHSITRHTGCTITRLILAALGLSIAIPAHPHEHEDCLAERVCR